MEEQGKYDVAEFADELARAPQNREVGTAVRFENDHVRVWEIVLEPGEWARSTPGRWASRCRSASTKSATAPSDHHEPRLLADAPD